jgi:hypothetical protein
MKMVRLRGASPTDTAEGTDRLALDTSALETLYDFS